MVHNSYMQVSVTDAKSQLTNLVKRAEAGDDVVLTRHGHAAVRLVPVKSIPSQLARRSLLRDVRASAARNAAVGETSARSQDFLYSRDGLPE